GTGMGGPEHAEPRGPGLVEGQPHERFGQRAVQVDEGPAVAAVHDDSGPDVDVQGLRPAAALRQPDAGTVFQLFEGAEHVVGFAAMFSREPPASAMARWETSRSPQARG